jgi:hypothetical protein
VVAGSEFSTVVVGGVFGVEVERAGQSRAGVFGGEVGTVWGDGAGVVVCVCVGSGVFGDVAGVIGIFILAV